MSLTAQYFEQAHIILCATANALSRYEIYCLQSYRRLLSLYMKLERDPLPYNIHQFLSISLLSYHVLVHQFQTPMNMKILLVQMQCCYDFNIEQAWRKNKTSWKSSMYWRPGSEVTTCLQSQRHGSEVTTCLQSQRHVMVVARQVQVLP